MAYCLDHDIPILGFCRGSQMLGVVSGATMIQDLPVWFASQNLDYNYEHRREKSEGETYRDYTPHDVKLAGDSHLAKMFGTTTLTAVPSWHHQAILSVDGTPLSVTATTSVSGIETIEGIERKNKALCRSCAVPPRSRHCQAFGQRCEQCQRFSIYVLQNGYASIQKFYRVLQVRHISFERN